MSDTIPVEDSDPQQSDYSPPDRAEGKRFRNPPELEDWQWYVLCALWVLGLCSLLFLIGACIWLVFPPEHKPQVSCEECLLAIPIGFILLWVYGHLWLKYDLNIHERQIQDRDMIEALIQNANEVAGRIRREQQASGGESQDNSAALGLGEEIEAEIGRLRAMTPEGWTYYQTLHLDQLLVDALDTEEALKARAELRLAVLKDYGEESSYQFDTEQYQNWENRLKVVTDPINSNEYWLHRGQLADQDHSEDARLRLGKETLKALLEYVAETESDWSSGSLILRNLRIGAIFTILALLPIAFLPVMCPWEMCGSIGWFEWGLLGIVGALLSVLRQLQNSDVIELGNTEGKKEFMRAVVGGLLGLVAGLISFAFIKSGLIAGRLFPFGDDTSPAANIFLPVIWAVGSGFWFEKIFERVRQTTG